MIVFKVLYYFIGLVFIFLEIGKLAKVKSYVRKITDYTSWAKMRKKKKESTEWGDIPEELKTHMLMITIYFISGLIWLGIGIFTFNWGFVLCYFVLMTLVTKFSSKKHIYSKRLVAWTGFWILFNICFYIFLIINTFHLHINFLELF